MNFIMTAWYPNMMKSCNFVIQIKTDLFAISSHMTSAMTFQDKQRQHLYTKEVAKPFPIRKNKNITDLKKHKLGRKIMIQLMVLRAKLYTQKQLDAEKPEEYQKNQKVCGEGDNEAQ